MKGWISIALIIALLLDVSLFIGVGFGSSALGIAQVPPTGTQYSQGTACAYEGLSCFTTVFTNVVAGSPLITSPQQGQQSTDLVFGVQAVLGSGSCDPGNERATSWNGGAVDGGTQAYYIIHFPFSVAGTINGAGYTGSTWYVSENGSVVNQVILSYCLVNYNSLGQVGQVQYASGGTYYPATMILTGTGSGGILPNLKVSITFVSEGQYCDAGTTLQVTGACKAAYNQAGGAANNVQAGDGPGSDWNAGATSSAVYQSAGLSFTFIGQPYQNGGTLSVSVNTGYDDGGYLLEILCPSPRSCGGSPDTSFSPNPQHVADNVIGKVYSWSIPSNAAQNNSVGPTWNTWTVALFTSYVTGQLSLTTIINPLYSPSQPGYSYTTSSGLVYPGVGDTVSLTIFANNSAAGTPATTATVAIYYQTAGANAEAAPTCGNGWVSGEPCPQGFTVSISNKVGTLSFVVQPPIGDTLIGLTVISGAANGQASTPLYAQIAIEPAGCQSGTACDPNHSGISLWQLVGPIFLSIAFILTGLIVAMWVPLAWVKYTAVIVPVAGVIIFYVFGVYTSWFAPGGLFNVT